MKKTYSVIYTWRNERHRVLETFYKLSEAQACMNDLRACKINAWIEEN